MSGVLNWDWEVGKKLIADLDKISALGYPFYLAAAVAVGVRVAVQSMLTSRISNGMCASWPVAFPTFSSWAGDAGCPTNWGGDSPRVDRRQGSRRAARRRAAHY